MNSKEVAKRITTTVDFEVPTDGETGEDMIEEAFWSIKIDRKEGKKLGLKDGQHVEITIKLLEAESESKKRE